MQLRQSMRRAAKMCLALAGASGSGKTHSSLLIAYGMTADWSKLAVIDSENCSADLYAHLGSYQVLTLDNYAPETYIEANIKAVDIDHLREDCIVPVFSKDNELIISHQMFIETVLGAAYRMFPNETIDAPDIVVSYIIKGRIPEAP